MTSFESSPESLDALGGAIAAGLQLLIPPPELTVSEWADRYARLSRESSAMPGQWVTANAEYQRGFMDCFNDPKVERVVVVWAAQTGKSAGLLNVIGYVAHQDQGPILMIQPTKDTAEAFSKDRIAPMIRDTPALTPLFGDPKSRDSANTLLHKPFPGGFLALIGANAPSGMASRPIRVALFDELDRAPASAGTEGDPLGLVAARLRTFWNRKLFLTSTPTIKGASRIEKEWEKSDKRRYFMPCPHCGESITFEWGNLKWPSPRSDNKLTEHKPDECYYVCPASKECVIEETDKPAMLATGEWIATAESADGKTAGFHLNALYSPWMTWPEIIRAWLGAQGDIEQLKTFVNTVLAETFEVQGAGIESDIFADRQMDYPEKADAPQGVLVVTAGVDVQDNRIEATAWGWAPGEESWALEHRIFAGTPSEQAVWSELEEWLKRSYLREDKVDLHIRRSMIDSGGHHTKEVYAFAKRMQRRGVYACVGRANNGGQAKPLLSKPTTGNDAGVLLYTVGVDTAKENFYGRLKIEQEGAGFCHFPRPAGDRFAWADKEFFAQLTAEHLVTKMHGSVAQKVWMKRRPRNEALDMRVYAMAALEHLRPNFAKWERNLLKRAAELVPVAAEPEPEPTPETFVRRQVETRRPPKRGGWVNAWK